MLQWLIRMGIRSESIPSPSSQKAHRNSFPYSTDQDCTEMNRKAQSMHDNLEVNYFRRS